MAGKFDGMSAADAVRMMRSGEIKPKDLSPEDVKSLMGIVKRGLGDLPDDVKLEMSIAQDFIMGVRGLALDFIKHSTLNGEQGAFACFQMGTHLAGALAMTFKAPKEAKTSDLTSEEISQVTGDMANLVVAGLLSELLVGQKLSAIGMDVKPFREMAAEFSKLPIGSGAGKVAKEVIDVALRRHDDKAAA